MELEHGKGHKTDGGVAAGGVAVACNYHACACMSRGYVIVAGVHLYALARTCENFTSTFNYTSLVTKSKKREEWRKSTGRWDRGGCVGKRDKEEKGGGGKKRKGGKGEKNKGGRKKKKWGK